MLINPSLTGSPVEPGTPPPPSVADKRSENAEQLRVAMRKLEANGASDTATAQEVAFYQSREALLTQQDTVEQQIKDLESRKAFLEELKQSPRPDSKQYKFADLDQMKDDLAAEQARAGFASDRLATAKANLQMAQNAVDDSDVKLRKAQRAYDNGKDAPNVSELAAAADNARQDATLANEAFALRKREFDRETLSQQVINLAIRLRQEKIARVSPQVKFTEADYNEQIENLRKSEAANTASLNQAFTDLHGVELDFQNAKKQLESATDVTRTALIESFIALRLTKDKLSEEIESRGQRATKFAQLKTAWKLRYQIANSEPTNTDHDAYAQLKDVQHKTTKVMDGLARELRMQISKMRDVRNSLTSAAKKAEAATKSSPEIAFQINSQQRQLEETLKIHEKNLVAIETSRRVHEKLLDEIGPKVEALTPTAIALGAWYQVEAAWNHVLVGSVGQKEPPITVGDAVKGLTILIVGWILSRSTAGMFANRFLRRFRLSKDATSVIRSLVFYSLLMSVVLTALNTVGVPLTAFTILGGGLAIGVGFGSQTLINNFIGGLIMLAERPVRLGERITLKDLDGVVEDVGFRCTKLRTLADHLVTIPNSTLVNESIENIDRRRTIRRSFTLAVTYNISRDQLAEGVQAIRDILEERQIRERIHPIVGFEELSPRVHFSDFAAESLNIKIDYWYAPADSSAFNEHSERVNFRIMEEFDRLGIDFAFPSKTNYVKKPNQGRSRGSDSYAA